jgi:hypothetical protein
LGQRERRRIKGKFKRGEGAVGGGAGCYQSCFRPAARVAEPGGDSLSLRS